MKNQTKAILASVMILALALSSIGGVTYSWFSDKETGNIEIGTSTVDVNTVLYVDNSQLEGLTIPITPGYNKTIEVEVTNESTIPVDVSAKVSSHLYQLVINGGYKEPRLLFKDGEVIETGAYNDYKNHITFNSNDSFIQEGPNIIDKSGTTTSGTVFTQVGHSYCYYELGQGPIEPGGTYVFSFVITVSQNYKMDTVEDPKIEVEAIQCSSITKEMTNGTAELDITDNLQSRSIVFHGSGVTVVISKEALESVNKVEISYITTSNSGTITLEYNDGNKIPTKGNVTIIFDSEDNDPFAGSISSSAKNTTFTFGAAQTGGSS